MAKKSQKPVGRPSKFPKLTNSKPDVKTACEKAYRVTAAGGGRIAVAAAFNVSYQTFLDWTDVECPRYKGKEFSEAVMEGLAVGQQKFMREVQEHTVEGPEDKRINMGAVKFLAQHQYGLVDKTQVETSGNMKVNINKEDSEL